MKQTLSTIALICGMLVLGGTMGIALSTEGTMTLGSPVQPTNTAPPAITGPTHTPCAPDAPVCPPPWEPGDTTTTFDVPPRPTMEATGVPTNTPPPPIVTPTPCTVVCTSDGWCSECQPPPDIRPTRTPTPAEEYPATLTVRCWHHADRTICFAVVVPNGENVILALYTKAGRSYEDEVINRYPFTVQITWMDVECGEWLGKFELKVLDAFSWEYPERSIEAIKRCAFIPEVTR